MSFVAESLRQKVSAAPRDTIAAVILAAGPSTRMGRPKQLLEFCGKPLLRRTALAALDASCRPVIVVTGANAIASREAVCELDVREIENQKWESGMSSSLRTGIKELIRIKPQATAVVVMLCDQPFLTPEIVRGLMRTHRETNCSVVACRYGESCGVPALFARVHFAELCALKGDQGAKAIISRHLGQAHLLFFPEGELDIDTPDDFARLQSLGCSAATRANPLS